MEIMIQKMNIIRTTGILLANQGCDIELVKMLF